MRLAAACRTFHQLGENKPIRHRGLTQHSGSHSPRAAGLRNGGALWAEGGTWGTPGMWVSTEQVVKGRHEGE